MKLYDLFKKLADGSPLWVCAEADLNEATAKMKRLAEESGSEYFVYEQSAETVVATSRNGDGSGEFPLT